MEFVTLVAGLVLLAVGGDILVTGATRIAAALHIPNLIVGLTIVAFGTSAPELVVSIEAALLGAPELAVGNVLGSNITNSLLIIGAPALITPLVATERGMRRNVLMMLVATLIFVSLMLDGVIDQSDAFVLLLGLVVFLIVSLFTARGHEHIIISDEDRGGPRASMWLATGMVVGGIVSLAFGGQWTVDGALGIAGLFNLGASAVGLTIVALGTSLPELAAGIAAARRRESSIVIGNVIGSNIFNIVAVAGITAMIAPLPVTERLAQWDGAFAAISALLLAALIWWRRPLDHRIGLILLIGYIAFIIEVLGFRVAN